jgi:alpha-D-xyloside xylohydrolase
VAPVYRYKAREREVYLPSACGWYDFYSGKFLNGGQKIHSEAPYGRMPLYVREGTILPVGPEIQYTGEKPADPVTIYIYTGRNGEFTLYEDEGINYNYEKGLFSTILMSYNEIKKEFTIHERKGEYPGMLKSRRFNVILIGKETAVGIDSGTKPDEIITYTGSRIVVQL